MAYEGEEVPAAWDYDDNGSVGFDDFNDNCNYYYYWISNICTKAENEGENDYRNDYYGVGSRCFAGDFVATGWTLIEG